MYSTEMFTTERHEAAGGFIYICQMHPTSQSFERASTVCNILFSLFLQKTSAVNDEME